LVHDAYAIFTPTPPRPAGDDDRLQRPGVSSAAMRSEPCPRRRIASSPASPAAGR
jgi:hypothetical protein